MIEGFNLEFRQGCRTTYLVEVPEVLKDFRCYRRFTKLRCDFGHNFVGSQVCYVKDESQSGFAG